MNWFTKTILLLKLWMYAVLQSKLLIHLIALGWASYWTSQYRCGDLASIEYAHMMMLLTLGWLILLQLKNLE